MMISEESQRIRIAIWGSSSGHNISNCKGSSSPSYGDCYFTSTKRLPSWREFAEGRLIFSQSCCYYEDLSSERESFEKQLPISLEISNLPLTSQLCALSSPSTLPQEVSSRCHHLMQSVSSRNVNIARSTDIVDLTTVPRKFPPTLKVAQKCHICGRGIARDLVRHIRTHNKESRFKCIYPRASCHHKTGYFNRQYDFKKHLLHRHFVLHANNVKRLRNLTDKLEHEGTCPCGERMKAREWLVHISTRDSNGKLECEDLRKKTEQDTNAIRAESRI